MRVKTWREGMGGLPSARTRIRSAALRSALRSAFSLYLSRATTTCTGSASRKPRSTIGTRIDRLLPSHSPLRSTVWSPSTRADSARWSRPAAALLVPAASFNGTWVAFASTLDALAGHAFQPDVPAPTSSVTTTQPTSAIAGTETGSCGAAAGVAPAP